MIELSGITKTYPSGIKALRGIDLSIIDGEIHAIVGENGAGKSTLMNILYGMTKPSSGTIRIEGKQVDIDHPRKAIQLGIGMVHQHFLLSQQLTVMENVVLGDEKPYTNKLGAISHSRMNKAVRKLTESMGLSINPKETVANLPIGKQQQVEILKVFYKNARVIILDEPTSVLSPLEIGDFLKFIRSLKDIGKTVLFISHRLGEVFAVADRITVLRKGEIAGTFNAGETDRSEIASSMIGHDFPLVASSDRKKLEEKVVLEVSSIRTDKTDIDGISFGVREGEIMGVAGVEGNGQETLFNVLLGTSKLEEGKILVDGQDISNKDIAERREYGIAYITDDRLKSCVAASRSIQENTIIGFHRRKRAGGFFMKRAALKEYTSSIVSKYNVVGANSSRSKVAALSGGNIQKLVVGRELEMSDKLLVVSQPTAGVDISSKQLIHNALKELARRKVAILVISSDLEELMTICDRMIVMYRGKVVAELMGPDYDKNELGRYMTGVKEL